MKNSFLYIILLLISFNLIGQQDIILTKYNTSSLFFNPAYAGSAGLEEAQFTLSYRDQWLGLDGSPKTILAGFDINLFDDKVGLGISTAVEMIGIESMVDVQASYAYRLILSEGYLAGGLRFGFQRFGFEFSDIDYGDDIDPIYDEGNISSNSLNVGLGFYYHTVDYFVGLSLPRIYSLDSKGAPERSLHTYIHAGAIFENESSGIQIEPSVLVKYQNAAPLQYTIGMNLWLLENFSVGAHYRSTDAIALSSEFIMGGLFSLGVAYDFTINELNTESLGTLELFLGYKFKYSEDRIPMSRGRGFR